METKVIAVIEAGMLRRWMAVAMLACVSVLLVYSGMGAGGSSMILRICAVAVGVATLLIALKLFRVTANRIELTVDGLRESSGISIATLDEIASLDRGLLAFKPTNGFVLRTHAPTVRCWRPGLWWRFGRRVGIGGVVSGAQTKFMADRLAELMAAKN